MNEKMDQLSKDLAAQVQKMAEKWAKHMYSMMAESLAEDRVRKLRKSMGVDSGPIFTIRKEDFKLPMTTGDDSE